MPYENKTGLPSVTEVLKPFLDTKWFTDDCRARGTFVHQACYAHLIGAYAAPLPGDWQGYVDSFKRWLDRASPVVDMAEKRLISTEHGYCGQLDFYGTIEGRAGRGVIDFKTAAQSHKWHLLQGAAYQRLVNDCAWGGNLRLKKDGSMPIFDPWPNGVANFDRFLCCLSAWRFFND